MTVPGGDPNHPPYGRGDGDSPLAAGPEAFEVPPRPQIEVLTDPDFTRRELRGNLQELGWTAKPTR